AAVRADAAPFEGGHDGLIEDVLAARRLRGEAHADIPSGGQRQQRGAAKKGTVSGQSGHGAQPPRKERSLALRIPRPRDTLKTVPGKGHSSSERWVIDQSFRAFRVFRVFRGVESRTERHSASGNGLKTLCCRMPAGVGLQAASFPRGRVNIWRLRWTSNELGYARHSKATQAAGSRMGGHCARSRNRKSAVRVADAF